jgi:hypothetical protein
MVLCHLTLKGVDYEVIPMPLKALAELGRDTLLGQAPGLAPRD